MPNLRGKTWTTTTPANVADAQHWEDHLISDESQARIESAVLSVNSLTPDEYGNVEIGNAGHIIQDEDGNDMDTEGTLQFLNADVTDDSVNGKTVVDCKGSKGDAATIAVGTVTTLPAGSSATVTNSGTSSAAVFDFGIPQGEDGSGTGDMKASDYDYDSSVKTAGGIAGYVAGVLPVITNTYSSTSFDGMSGVAVASAISEIPLPTITDTYSDVSHDGMSGVAVASAISGKADTTSLDGFIGPAYATVSSSIYTVVFDDLDDDYGYKICINDGIAKYQKIIKGTGTNTGIKLTYTINSKYIDITTGNTVTVQTGSGGTEFYLRVLK